MLKVIMSEFFRFEADFVESLRCIPMQVRLKLDTCGIKLKLPQWNQFNPEQRQQLVERPCTDLSDVQSYRSLLQSLVLETTGEVASEFAIESDPAWLDPTTIPRSVVEKAADCGVTSMECDRASAAICLD
jgi:hypothetical protein